MTDLSFEQGPIRPPSEAMSLLLRVSRNCSWNQCIFCSTYTGDKFGRRSVNEVKADIDTIVEIIDQAKVLSWKTGASGQITAQVAQSFFDQGRDQSFLNVVAWLYHNTRAVFLQDANNLILKADDLVEMLNYLNRCIPGISRITTYSRSQTVARKDLDDLKRVREAGLDRVHVGLESGNDAVLKMMKKGVTGKGHIEGGRKIIDAGMELSEYYMPGLGGKALWREHSIDTAKVLNEINANFVRLRTLHVSQQLPLARKVESGEFQLQSDDEVIEEIRLFIETLDGITTYVASDHIGNLIQDVEGQLPQDKQKLLDALDRYLDLDREHRLHYRIGRMMGLYAGVNDMERPDLFQRVQSTVDSLTQKYPGELEDVLVDVRTQLTRL
ncbi:MAG: radical SAM protein [Deltaproteobacteria bacterium]|nr:radical SAM protein [Deltaproteobacteria bacterium]